MTVIDSAGEVAALIAIQAHLRRALDALPVAPPPSWDSIAQQHYRLWLQDVRRDIDEAEHQIEVAIRFA